MAMALSPRARMALTNAAPKPLLQPVTSQTSWAEAGTLWWING